MGGQNTLIKKKLLSVIIYLTIFTNQRNSINSENYFDNLSLLLSENLILGES